MRAQFPQVADGIRSKREMTKDVESALRQGIEAYKKQVGSGKTGVGTAA
jgi:hypothetical protein